MPLATDRGRARWLWAAVLGVATAVAGLAAPGAAVQSKPTVVIVSPEDGEPPRSSVHFAIALEKIVRDQEAQR